ncbi:MAG: SUMF1/EgtB/PvdO family nonheme iron enzyme, partial [Rhizobiales bacterium]|nr:SUMF1/EgtB/PvdO family nonheme iron enzyme [Hyphomicrobiales bacterium]
LWMGYLKPRSREGVAQYPVVLPPLESDKSLDYAILKVRGTPGREWGTIALAPAAIGRRQSLFVVHHPGGFEKHITLGGCRASDPAEDGDDLLHHCDTMGGSSGAPIFDVASRRVVGLHYSAVALKGLNAGKRMARLVAASARLRDLAPVDEAPRQSGPAAPAPPPQSEEAVAWGAIQSNATCGVLDSFIARFEAGGSVFVDFARARQRELKCGEEKVAVGSFPETPAPAPSPPAGCAGVMTEVVGKGRVCLDPTDEARREFQDCRGGLCGPRMVVVPAGSFLMGSPESEEGREDNEGPQRRVTIAKPFAVGKFEVTFAEWDACVAAKACRHKPDDEGWGRGQRPVINVSWDHVTIDYLPWLNKTLGLSGVAAYRLLSEAEWEYAARAGTATPFSFGRTISTDQANYDGTFFYQSGRMGRYRKWTVEVGSFPFNAFGLHDMHGNVREWVADSWHENYSDAPTDGAARMLDGDTGTRVIRGGSWNNAPWDLRAARRFNLKPDFRFEVIGFRVARSLSR